MKKLPAWMLDKGKVNHTATAPRKQPPMREGVMKGLVEGYRVVRADSLGFEEPPKCETCHYVECNCEKGLEAAREIDESVASKFRYVRIKWETSNA